MNTPVGKPSPATEAWPGLFSAHTLHRVQPANATRLAAGRARYGLADCGAACIRARPDTERDPCTTCYPPGWPQPGDDPGTPAGTPAGPQDVRAR